MLGFIEKYWTEIGLAIAMSVSIWVFFASKKRAIIGLTVSDETLVRLEKMRQDLEQLSGKSITLDDLVANAIERYHECVSADADRATFHVVGRDGTVTPLQLFEKDAA